VQDDGGTTGGGVDTDQSPNTLTFSIFAVNHAPTGSGEGEAAASDSYFADLRGFDQPLAAAPTAVQRDMNDVIALLAADTVTEQARRRRFDSAAGWENGKRDFGDELGLVRPTWQLPPWRWPGRP
jgi:hypothetical protein